MEVFKAGISCHINLNFQDQDAFIQLLTNLGPFTMCILVLNNSETMLVSLLVLLVLHFNGQKKKNHMLIVQASQSCLASFRYSVFFHIVIIFFVKIR